MMSQMAPLTFFVRLSAKAASDETLRTWLADLGGWPLLSPGSWNQPNTTLENFIASLKVSVEYPFRREQQSIDACVIWPIR